MEESLVFHIQTDAIDDLLTLDLTHDAHLGGKCKKSVNYENIEL